MKVRRARPPVRGAQKNWTARLNGATVKLDGARQLENEGITDDIRKAFVVYLASHDRPINELIEPTRKDIRPIYESEFVGMTVEEIEYGDLIATRETLISF